MKNKLMRAVMAACLIVSVVGCGPETVALVVATTQAATFVGAIAGAMWMVKSVENVSLDTRLKTLQIQAMQDGIREYHEVQLTDDEFEEVQRTGAVRIGNSNYRVE